jgi:hypothetical protein
MRAMIATTIAGEGRLTGTFDIDVLLSCRPLRAAG